MDIVTPYEIAVNDVLEDFLDKIFNILILPAFLLLGSQNKSTPPLSLSTHLYYNKLETKNGTIIRLK
ncbi:hypothetical protein [Listeria welshimeri]|uniref:hypothetical protein n=1 Tax=Listeria welshimeri TaxID=1643 RepID=UPI001E3DD3CB|nr:hypothetical protein [Listeria welshimeri]